MQFKTRVWGIIEFRNGAIFHASTSHLERLDNMQANFLHELDITEPQAFLDHNFAPLTLRRDIGMLGFLHKRVIGLAHPSIEALSPRYNDIFSIPRRGHNKQLYNNFREIHFQHGLYSRSIFSQVDVYNNLPQHAIDCTSVAAFQGFLTHIARTKCQANDAKWCYAFNTRSRSRSQDL